MEEMPERKRAELTLSDRAELRALRDFLGWAAPRVRVLQWPTRSAPGERAVLDQLTLVATSADLVTAMKLLPEFLRSRRTTTSATVVVEGASVALTETNLDETLPVLTRLLSA
jgi:hypothetical protein